MRDVAESSQQSQARAVAESYFASFATADPKMISAHVSPDFINEHTAALGTGCLGRTEYAARLVGFLSDMAGLQYEIEYLVTDGSDVAVFYTMRASWKSTASFVIRGAQRLRIVNGLITHRTDYWDSAAFLTQVSGEAQTALAAFGVSGQPAS